MSLGPQTKTTLGTLCIVCGALLAGWMYLDRRFTEQDAQYRATQAQLSELAKEIAEVKAEQYTTAMAAEQALRMALENPGMRVPDPRDPNKIIVVDKGRMIGGT
jgi:Tfp pilus assembly protein PilN